MIHFADFRERDSFRDIVEERITTPIALRYIQGFGIPLAAAVAGYIASESSYQTAGLYAGAVSLGLCCTRGSRTSYRTLIGYRVGIAVGLTAFVSAVTDMLYPNL